MHLVGYLYEDYHDARSLEHKKEGRVMAKALTHRRRRVEGRVRLYVGVTGKAMLGKGSPFPIFSLPYQYHSNCIPCLFFHIPQVPYNISN
jgi:hypothetical protein